MSQPPRSLLYVFYIYNPPALTSSLFFTQIVACRCVRRLNNYATEQSVQVYNSGPRTNALSGGIGGRHTSSMPRSNGVRIHMTTITHADDAVALDLEAQKGMEAVCEEKGDIAPDSDCGHATDEKHVTQ